MQTAYLRRLGLGGAAVFCMLPVMFAPAEAPPGQAKAAPAKNEAFKGKVVRLADFVEKHGSKLDPEAAPHWLALATDDGKVYPLIEDDGGRMFFKDGKLLNRPMRLIGQLHEVYYWCDVCSIKRFEKKKCDCCGGPMELREEPVKK